jgi:ATP-dependent DNA helicase RecG
MNAAELEQQIRELRRVKTDLTHVEAKASSELPKRIWETLSAFSNTSKGGVLILGVSEVLQFKVVGVKNPKKFRTISPASAT